MDINVNLIVMKSVEIKVVIEFINSVIIVKIKISLGKNVLHAKKAIGVKIAHGYAPKHVRE